MKMGNWGGCRGRGCLVVEDGRDPIGVVGS